VNKSEHRVAEAFKMLLGSQATTGNRSRSGGNFLIGARVKSSRTDAAGRLFGWFNGSLFGGFGHFGRFRWSSFGLWLRLFGGSVFLAQSWCFSG
jgi:hypothetical protein